MGAPASTSTATPRSTFDQPISRRGCIAGVVAWLLAMLVPLVACALIARGEVTWQRDELTYDRLAVINQAEAVGLAYERTRVTSDERKAGGPICLVTRVDYWLIRGQAEPAEVTTCT